MNGLLEGSDTHLMLDSGSHISFISETTRMSIPALAKRPLTKNFVLSKAVTGHSLDTLGTIEITLKMGSHILHHYVQVMRNVSEGTLLGTDFLQLHKAVLDFGRGICSLYGEDIPLLRKTQLTPLNCTARITDCTVVPPRCQINCKVSLTPPTVTVGTPNDYDGCLEPYQLDLDGISVARTLTKVKNGFAVIRLMNPTNGPVTLQPGMQIGQFSPVSKEDIVTDCAPVESTPVCRIDIDQTHVPINSIKSEHQLQLPFDLSGEHLSPLEKSQLKGLLLKYLDIFSKSPTDFGQTDIVRHKINTNAASPVRKRAYRTSPQMQEVIESQVNEMLDKGLIEPSHSPWAAPVVMVRKKDGSWRFCVDYRGLNAVTTKDAHPLPRTDDTLDALRGSSVFTTMDLSSGYWQVQLDEQDKVKTAFTTGRGLYQFKVMPMGLVNSPPTFQHLMQLVLEGLSWKTCLVYLDDIIVYSANFPAHLEHLQEVFDRLRAANLKLKPSKCHFAQKQVTFLGHVVSAGGLRPDPNNVEKVKQWPTPDSPTTVRAFLGLCSYYRRFIYQYANLSEPLHALTQKGKIFCWTETEQKAFDALRHALSSAPILSYPDFSREFLLFTDASNLAIGCVLSQMNDKNMENVIAYGSHVLTKREKCWSTYDRELWAIVWSIRQYRQYLTGHRFRIITDHKPLLSLRKMALDCDPTGRRARWALEIDPYDWIVEHRQGHKHANADSMSRRPSPAADSPTDLSLLQCSSVDQTVTAKPVNLPILSVQQVCSGQDIELSFLNRDSHYVRQAQESDPVLKTVLEWVLTNNRPHFAKIKRCVP